MSADKPLRILVVLPSWVGDAVMATPTLRRIRNSMPGAFIGALCKPPIERLMRGTGLVDEIHTFHPNGLMAPKRAASKVRPRRYGVAVLLTNSFSTALITRLAFIDRRLGYDRDGRGVLLTQRVAPPKRDGAYAITPAVDYYWNLASVLLGETPVDWSTHTPSDCVSMPLALDPSARMELPITDEDEHDAAGVLERAGVGPGEPYAVLNPGGNNDKKRWPADRYARLADHLSRAYGLRVLVNGSPDESALVDEIVSRTSCDVVSLPAAGNTLGALKPILRDARLMVTNDTGPRHIAVACSTPTVSLFGPTDPRWTTVPTDAFADGSPKETVLVADETLDPSESSNDHPERCAIGHISEDRVRAAADAMLGRCG